MALGFVLGMVAWAEPQVGKQRAIAELAAAGLSWDDGKRAIAVTDDGRMKLKDLRAVERALRELQPRSIDLSSCAALEKVDGVRGLRSLEAIFLTDCAALKNVDGVAGSDRLRKIYLFESMNVATESLEELQRRFPKSYIVLPDGTGLNPPRKKD